MSNNQAELKVNCPNSQQIDWGKAFESHRSWLSTIVHSRLADPHAVADVLQEVALAAISQSNRPCSQDKIAPWLYRITLRKIVNHHRSNGRRRKLIESVATRTNPTTHQQPQEPGAWLLQKELSTSVQQAIAQLPPQDRQILLLKYTEGWGYELLAKHLGVSIKTIEYRLLKARRALRAALSDEP